MSPDNPENIINKNPDLLKNFMGEMEAMEDFNENRKGRLKAMNRKNKIDKILGMKTEEESADFIINKWILKKKG